MAIEIEGLDELQRELESFERKARGLEGNREVPFEELFTQAFMSKHTSVASFDALIEAGGFQVKSAGEFEAIPDAAWDCNVAAHTSFSNWEAMLSAASEEWIQRQF